MATRYVSTGAMTVPVRDLEDQEHSAEEEEYDYPVLESSDQELLSEFEEHIIGYTRSFGRGTSDRDISETDRIRKEILRRMSKG